VSSIDLLVHTLICILQHQFCCTLRFLSDVALWPWQLAVWTISLFELPECILV